MKAGWFEKFGAAEDVIHVGEQPKPTVGVGQVLVKLAGIYWVKRSDYACQ